MIGTGQGLQLKETADDTGGPISASPYENPDFAGWNHILVPACDHTSFIGSRGRQAVSLPGKRKGHFNGHDILLGVVSDLVSSKGLSVTGKFLLVGSGTGGFSVLSNIDAVVASLRSLVGDKKEVVGLVDAAFVPSFPVGSAASRVLEKARSSLWGGVEPLGGCGNGEAGANQNCMSAQHVAGNVSSPLFVVQASHDPVHMNFAHSLGACSGQGSLASGKGCQSDGVMSGEWRDAVLESLEAIKGHRSHGLYLIGCRSHEGLVSKGCKLGDACPNWRDHYVQVGCQRISAQEAFGEWYVMRPWARRAKLEYRTVIDRSLAAQNPSCNAGYEEATCSEV
jgi:hypothetical protein